MGPESIVNTNVVYPPVAAPNSENNTPAQNNLPAPAAAPAPVPAPAPSLPAPSQAPPQAPSQAPPPVSIASSSPAPALVSSSKGSGPVPSPQPVASVYSSVSVTEKVAIPSNTLSAPYDDSISAITTRTKGPSEFQDSHAYHPTASFINLILATLFIL
ncbi:hypothetical protein DSO57_1031903 [Entomophthora muscae]|uniref:Uncharacterized protein n=1 Tax=Entomophthora muscae TaxID=34485 RepID=A0ACC2TBL4_9FUNG|nr:hypothetical protein DSO57_1031903 [Entomophthora muscae]